ncbi:MAG: hypothetical protein ACRES9_00285 [Gammaproteobacteria bacterium]
MMRFNKSVATGDEADWIAQVVHQIAPQAKLASCYYALGVPGCVARLIQDFHANVIVLDAGRRYPAKFNYSSRAIALSKLHRKYPDVLLFSAVGNYSGLFYRGKWRSVKWNIDGSEVFAQDFGLSTGQPSRPYNVIRISRATDLLEIKGHVRTVGANSTCPNLPLQLVLMNRHDPVVAKARLRSHGNHCDSLQLTAFPEAKETVYRVALVAPLSMTHVKFRLRLRAFGYITTTKPHAGKEGGQSYNYYQAIDWRYATSGTAGAMVGAFARSGVMSIAPLNPYTAFHGRYHRGQFASVGPACYLPVKGQHPTRRRLFCYQQPRLAAPVMASVARPAHNVRGYKYFPFDGSSAAGPPIAGVAALLLSAGVIPKQIPRLLEETGIKQPRQLRWSPFYGYGQIDADAAAREAGVLKGNVRPTANPIAENYQYKITKSKKPIPHVKVAVTHNPAMRKLAIAAEAGVPEAMWELGNAMQGANYYARYDIWAALVWWQRAARRKYAAAFCSLGGAYAYAPNDVGFGPAHHRYAQYPIPYRPRLALALFEACARLGGNSKQKAPILARLQSNLSDEAAAFAERLSIHLAQDPSRYLPSLNYEYIPQ